MSLTISLVSILLLLLSDLVRDDDAQDLGKVYYHSRLAQAVAPRLKGICDFPLPSQVIGKQIPIFQLFVGEKTCKLSFMKCKFSQLLVVSLATSLSLPFQLAEVKIWLLIGNI